MRLRKELMQTNLPKNMKILIDNVSCNFGVVRLSPKDLEKSIVDRWRANHQLGMKKHEWKLHFICIHIAAFHINQKFLVELRDFLIYRLTHIQSGSCPT